MSFRGRTFSQYVCQTGEIFWMTVLFIVCSILLIFFVIIEVKGGPESIREKHLWIYVLCIWPALAIMIAILHHTQQLRAFFRRNRMELPKVTALAQDTYALKKKASVWRKPAYEKPFKRINILKISRLDTLASALAFGVTGIVFEFLVAICLL
ncbi:hypothetical protein CEXT_313471 [Caerostris extrusa]|uniref:Gustatory receptor n=1 Tax=Caerostris extrusa TaxID=172846 RepID=A0AAV4W9M7_CAEEX|nr:hypothetical protein CEXT_313471 [Caerostris extrusa]